MDNMFDSFNFIFLVVGGLFFLIGFILFIVTFISIVKSISSRKWPVASGVVIKSEFKKGTVTSPGKAPVTSYKPQIEFSYSIDGRNYKSKNLYFGRKLTSAGSLLRSKKMTDQYPVEKKIKVHYNPRKEKEAVVEPGFHIELLMGVVVSVVLMVFSLIFLRFGFFDSLII